MEIVKKIGIRLLLFAVVPLLLAGCGLFQRPARTRLVPVEEVPPIPTRVPTPRPTPTQVPTPTHTATAVPVKLPAECEEVLNNVKLTDLLKHRQLFSIALQLEFKDRNDEAIVVLEKALTFRPDNKLTQMKIAQLKREQEQRKATMPKATVQEKAAPLPLEIAEKEQAIEAPPDLDLPDNYLDIVNNVKLSGCAKGYRLFLLGSSLENEGRHIKALFVYRKAISLCPEKDGPNATINRQAREKITLLEKRVLSEKLKENLETPPKKH